MTGRRKSARRFTIVCAIMAGMLLFAAGRRFAVDAQNSQRIHFVTDSGARSLVASLNPLDFGELAPGGQKALRFSLLNPGLEPIQITEIHASCDCLKIALDRRLVDPGATIDVTATVDFSGDPHFVGKLAVEILGKQDGSSVFCLTAKINVRTESRVTQR